MINPFWLETRFEDVSWREEIDLGRRASSQVRSSREDADFWLKVKFVIGGSRCIIVGK